MTYEEYKKKCYELGEKEDDPKYAKECLDFADEIGEIERFFKEGKDVKSAVYLLCYQQQQNLNNLAECVADYFVNRENASDLSKKVWEILKKELG